MIDMQYRRLGVTMRVLRAGLLVCAIGVVAPLPVLAQDTTVYDWTGFYAGVFGGVGNSTFLDDVNGTYGRGSGVLGGIQAGYTQQLSMVVFGVDADIAVAGLGGTYDAGLVVDGGKASIDALGTVRARLGFAIEEFQIYGIGGFAYGHVSDQFLATSDSGWLTGWAAGLGATFGITENVSIDMRYLHFELGPTPFYGGAFQESAKANVFTGGVNFQF